MLSGYSGWALEGRVNDIILNETAIIETKIHPVDWVLMGKVDVKHGSKFVTTYVDLSRLLAGGDHVVVNGLFLTISDSEPIRATGFLLKSEYMGDDAHETHLFRASNKCLTGLQHVEYTPLVQGQYLIDIRLKNESISGFPTTLVVEPGKTDPSVTTAFGAGLKVGKAGDEMSFMIQAKDSHGNNKLSHQPIDSFMIYAFPENSDSSGVIGNVTSMGNGLYEARFTPMKSGYHVVAIVLNTQTERQTIFTQYEGTVRGSFIIVFNGNQSNPIPWNANSTFIQETIRLLPELASVVVSREVVGNTNYVYSITFDGVTGNIPMIEVDLSNIEGSSEPWKFESVDGYYEHIKMEKVEKTYENIPSDSRLQHEIQSIRLKRNQITVPEEPFILSFMARNSTQLFFHTTTDELKDALESIDFVGNLNVELVQDDDFTKQWLITFGYGQQRCFKSLRNFGNLPQLTVVQRAANITIDISTLQDGFTPYRVLVSPNIPSAEYTHAFDHPGLPLFEGKTTGIYSTKSSFKIQMKDKFSNFVHDGPVSEVQVTIIYLLLYS